MAKPAPGTLSAQDVAAIRATTDRFTELMLARDFDKLAQLYTADAAVLPPNQPVVQGQAQIKTWLEAFPKTTRFSIEFQEIEGRDDLAYVRGSYSMTVEPDGTPGPVDDVGKFLEIRKRQADGSWPLAVDMFSSDNA